MTSLRALAIGALAGATLAIAPAARACSFTWEHGHSPREIERRDDLIKVKGTFVFIDAISGQDVPEGEFKLTKNGDALGRIDRTRGRPILTKNFYPNDVMMDCGAYLGPAGNVSGSFWLEPELDTHGRRRLLMWRPE